MSDALDIAARTVAWPVAAGILANALDELFMDVSYFARRFQMRQRRAIQQEELDAAPRRRVAIMVPAWHEAAVIAPMLEHNLKTLDYFPRSFDVFCGTYPNDPLTQQQVDQVARRHPNVHKVVVQHDGPTCKADCLNAVYRAIGEEEEKHQRPYEIVLIHDAEDVIHPLSLKVYSLLIPAYDFVQTPVFSAPLRLRDWVAGTYIDEFAEHHLKDMRVREEMGGLLPAAGVGCAFSRSALSEQAALQRGDLFPADSLTEDYEIGLQLRLAHKKAHFACLTVARTRLRQGRFGRPRMVVEEEYIATRELFPNRFRASVRQRSRWITGITLQSWEKLGWKGSGSVLYSLWRDRKTLLTNLLLLLAYTLFIYMGGRAVAAWLTGSAWGFHDVVRPHSALWWLMLINTGFLLWRAVMKMHFVGRLYGPWQALAAVPRLVVGNIVSLAATAKAVTGWIRHIATGQPLRWLKTAHALPAAAAAAGHRRLGEVLMARGALDARELQSALSQQTQTGERLGEILLRKRVVSASALAEALNALLGEAPRTGVAA